MPKVTPECLGLGHLGPQKAARFDVGAAQQLIRPDASGSFLFMVLPLT